MSRNVEIKARVQDLDRLESIVADLCPSPPQVLNQDDRFFICPNGRLKLRQITPTQGELIFYIRTDQEGPKQCYYQIALTEDPQQLAQVLSEAYGCEGRVIKRRKVYLAGRTRIHLDRVEGLGDFMELEVVLEEAESLEAGMKEAHRLMDKLGIEHDHLIDTAYHDLIRQQANL